MSEQQEYKQKVRKFYDAIGWSRESSGYYQNAHYEDLRPVSAEYIHNCHLRITPYFKDGGKLLLDLGSGPVQYDEYLTYSEHFEKRLCADISITALREARERLGDKGLYVVCDAANLPFKDECIDGVVSLHTFHHLDLEEQKKAWYECCRVMTKKAVAVIVNGWTESAMMKKWLGRMLFAEKVGTKIAELRGKQPKKIGKTQKPAEKEKGTYTKKMDPEWIRENLSGLNGGNVEIQIRCWRSVSVRWLRALIHNPYGKAALKHLYNKEEQNPEYYGEYGQYPMIIMRKK